MAHLPHSATTDRINDLIEGAMREAAGLSWGAPGEDGGVTALSPAQALPGYQVLKEIRSGGQGVVYLGVEEATDRRVAIKVLRPLPAITPKDRYRFEREVEVLQEFCHPGIVRILHADANAPSPYIVMEHVPGWNLDEYLREHDLDVRATMRMFRSIVLAIQAAHQKGVIHRDVKPSNIRVDHNAEPRVFDFGLAKLSWAPAPDATVTEAGQFLGTLHWVSPEQAEGRLQDVDVRTDLYSLGVVLYNMLTGELPFEQGGSMREVLNRIGTAEPIPPSTRRREIDDDVETIVLKCLAKDPQRRYASASELAEDVERWLNGRPIMAKRDSLTYVAGKFLKRHWVGCLLVGLLSFSVMTPVAGYAWYRSHKERSGRALVTMRSFYQSWGEPRRNVPIDLQLEEGRAISFIKLADSLPASPEDKLWIREDLAVYCAACGFHGLAYSQGTAAVEAARRLFGEVSEPHIIAAAACSGYARSLGDLRAAEALSTAALAAARRLDPVNNNALSRAYECHAHVCLEKGDLLEAGNMVRKAVASARMWCNGFGGERADVALALSLKNAADTLYVVIRERRARGMEFAVLFDEAISLQREGLRHARQAGQKGEELAHNVHALATQLREDGRLKEADPLAREAVELRLAISPDSAEVVYLYTSKGGLGVLRMYQGDFEDAETLLREAVEGLGMSRAPIFRQMRAEFATRLAELYELGCLYCSNGDMAVEARHWREVVWEEADR